MALSERSLRDLRKIADLDAKTEASNAAKAVADRRATALQDALAERAGRIAALERACRIASRCRTAWMIAADMPAESRGHARRPSAVASCPRN